MAITITGSIQSTTDDDPSPGAWSVTIPSDTKAAVFYFRGYVNDIVFLSATIGGVPCDQLAQDPPVAGDRDDAGLAVWVNPPTGTQLLRWEWNLAPAAGEFTGALVCYTATGAIEIVDVDVISSTSAASTTQTRTLTTVTGGYVSICAGAGASATPDVAPAASDQTADSSAFGTIDKIIIGHENTVTAGTETISAESSWASVAGVSFAELDRPTISSTSPSDNATGVSRTASPAVTFNQNVDAGSGNFYVWNVTRCFLHETIAVGSASISSATVTLDPVSDFRYGEEYAITWDAGVVVADDDAAAVAALTDKTTWNFRAEELTSAGTGGGLVVGSSASFVGEAFVGATEAAAQVDQPPIRSRDLAREVPPAEPLPQRRIFVPLPSGTAAPEAHPPPLRRLAEQLTAEERVARRLLAKQFMLPADQPPLWVRTVRDEPPTPEVPQRRLPVPPAPVVAEAQLPRTRRVTEEPTIPERVARRLLTFPIGTSVDTPPFELNRTIPAEPQPEELPPRQLVVQAPPPVTPADEPPRRALPRAFYEPPPDPPVQRRLLVPIPGAVPDPPPLKLRRSLPDEPPPDPRLSRRAPVPPPFVPPDAPPLRVRRSLPDEPPPPLPVTRLRGRPLPSAIPDNPPPPRARVRFEDREIALSRELPVRRARPTPEGVIALTVIGPDLPGGFFVIPRKSSVMIPPTGEGLIV